MNFYLFLTMILYERYRGVEVFMQKTYLCIDLKSFYASVECVELGLDPFEVNLVVADPTRGGGAITLAATPAIKKLGVSSRGRIFEIDPKIEYMITPPRMTCIWNIAAKSIKSSWNLLPKKIFMSIPLTNPFWMSQAI